LNALHNIVEPTGTNGAEVSDFRADGKDGAIDYKTQFLPSLPWDHPLSELRRLLAGEGEGFHDLYRLVRRDEKAVLRHPLDIAAEDLADAVGLIDELRDPDQPYSVGAFASDVRRAWETLTMEDRVLSAHVWAQTAKMGVLAEAAKHEDLRRAA